MKIHSGINEEPKFAVESMKNPIFNPESWEFVTAYIIVSGAFAMLVYSISMVSIPIILDRDTDAISAAITSLEVMFHNTAVMLFWGMLSIVLVCSSLAFPWEIGLLLTGPLLGYSSWYAYRGAVRWPQDVTVPRINESTLWQHPITVTKNARRNWQKRRKKKRS